MKRNEIVVLTFAGIVLIFASLILIFGFSFIGCKNKSSSSKSSSISEFFERGDHVIKNAVQDAEGNTYDAVKLGDQVWMAENLRTTKNFDRLYEGIVQTGDDINISPSYDPVNPGFLYVVGNYGGKEIYYNNLAAASLELCPNGWRLPSLDDWKLLENYLKTKPEYIAGNCEANVAKALASNEGWDYYTNPTPDDYGKIAYNPMTTNNATGFSAKPVGYVAVNNNPKRDMVGLYLFDGGTSAKFWTSSTNASDETAYIILDYRESTISFFWDITAEHPDLYGSYHDDYYSVRCIKNE